MSGVERAPGQIGPAAPCRACGTLVTWCGTAVPDKSVALESIPSAYGTQTVYPVSGQLFAAPVKPRQAAAMRAAGRPLYLKHSASCEPTRKAEK